MTELASKTTDITEITQNPRQNIIIKCNQLIEKGNMQTLNHDGISEEISVFREDLVHDFPNKAFLVVQIVQTKYDEKNRPLPHPATDQYFFYPDHVLLESNTTLEPERKSSKMEEKDLVKLCKTLNKV
jgi:hypothetical protein